MRKRTRGREFALFILYQVDITGDGYAAALEGFWQDRAEDDIDQELKDFTAAIVQGVSANRSCIDKKITQYAENWQLERMAVVDRNILRIGSFELLFHGGIPPKVAINEAVELAKKYSGIEAGKFVNAILDKIKSEKEKQ